MSILNRVRNISRIHEWVSREPSQIYLDRKFSISFNQDNINVIDRELIQVCPVCLELPRFPLILSCGHVMCHICLVELFKQRSKRINKELCIKCPVCRTARVKLDKISSLTTALSMNTHNRVTSFYKESTIKCGNRGCKHSPLPLADVNQHEFFDCVNRCLNCPAKLCPFRGPAIVLEEHMLQCTFHTTICETCVTERRVNDIDHSCLDTFFLQSSCIRDYHPIIRPANYRSGDVLLPTNQKPFDPIEVAIRRIRRIIKEEKSTDELEDSSDEVEFDSSSEEEYSIESFLMREIIQSLFDDTMLFLSTDSDSD